MVQLDMSLVISDDGTLPQRSRKGSQSIKWKVIEKDGYWTRYISKFAKAQIPAGKKWHWCEWFSTATGNVWFVHSFCGFAAFQSSFLPETQWKPPGDPPRCSSNAADFVVPWRSTAPNPPRHRGAWFECCRWWPSCQPQTSQLRSDFACAAWGGNHQKKTSFENTPMKDFILHFHCIDSIQDLSIHRPLFKLRIHARHLKSMLLSCM